MKTNYLKSAMIISATLMCTALTAQTKKQTAYTQYGENTYTFNKTNGNLQEYIKTDWKGDSYEIKLLNGKPTMLNVNGKLVPASEYGKYAAMITEIRMRIKEDRAQAIKDQEQARRDQEQAKRDQEQAKRDQEQAKRDQEQARRDQDQARREQDEARRDQEEAKVQAKRDQEQADRDQQQAKREQEEAAREQQQASRDQEQAERDQVQAKKDQAQAAEDQRQLKMLEADLITDGLVPNEAALRSLQMNADEMIVNGKKVPDSVFNKYKEKYSRFARGHNDGQNFNGLNILKGTDTELN
jgi:colicin import membrane protein